MQPRHDHEHGAGRAAPAATERAHRSLLADPTLSRSLIRPRGDAGTARAADTVHAPRSPHSVLGPLGVDIHRHAPNGQ